MEPDEIREGLRNYRKRLNKNIVNWAKTAIIPITDEFARTLRTYNIETLSANDEKTDEYLGESISLLTFANRIYKDDIPIDEKRALISQMEQANKKANLVYGDSLRKLLHLLELEALVAHRDEIGEEKFAASLAKLRKDSGLAENDPLREMYDRAERSVERDTNASGKKLRIITTSYAGSYNNSDLSKLLTNEYKDTALNYIIFDIGKANYERWKNIDIGLKGIIDARVASLPEGYRTMDNIYVDEEYLARVYGKEQPDYNKAIVVKNASEWVWDGKSTTPTIVPKNSRALAAIPEGSRALATTTRQRDGEFEPPPAANRPELTGDELDHIFDEANKEENRRKILHDAAMDQLWEEKPELAGQLGEEKKKDYSKLFLDYRNGNPDASLDDQEAERLYDEYDRIYRELERLPVHEIKRSTKEPDRVGRTPVLEVEGKLESGIKELDQFLALVKPITDLFVKGLHMPRFMLMQWWDDRKETAKLVNEHMKYSSYAFDDMYSLWKPKPPGMSDDDYEEQKKRDRAPLKNPDQLDNWMSQRFHDVLIRNLRNSDPKYARETDFFKQIFGEEDSKAYLGVFHEYIRETIKDKVAAGQDLKDAVGSTLNSFSILLENEAKASPDSLNLYHSLIDDYWIEDVYKVLKGGATYKEEPDIDTYDPLADFEDKSDKNKRMTDMLDLFETMKSGRTTP